MKEFKTIEDIWEYDCSLSDVVGDFISEEFDDGLEYDSSLKEVVTEDKIVLNCKPSKKFVIEEKRLKDLAMIFVAGTIRIESDGKKVEVTLKSKRAMAHSWIVNKIVLDYKVAAGINGFRNTYIYTEDEVNVFDNSNFISVHPLETSEFPSKELAEDKVIVNKNQIAMIIPIQFYTYIQ